MYSVRIPSEEGVDASAKSWDLGFQRVRTLIMPLGGLALRGDVGHKRGYGGGGNRQKGTAAM